MTTGTFLARIDAYWHQPASRRTGRGSRRDGTLRLLEELGFELGRLKTGTPPRLLRRSIDFSKTEIQPGDEPLSYFTFWKDDLFHVEHSLSQLRMVSDDISVADATDAVETTALLKKSNTLQARFWPRLTGNCRATSLIPRMPQPRSSATTCTNPRCIRGPLKVSGRDIVHQ